MGTEIKNGIAVTRLRPSAGGAEYAALMVGSESDITVEGYSVPALTAEQVTAAYNAVVAGRGCIVVDKDDIGHFFVNQADSLNGDITIEILFYSYMLVAYTLSGDTVSVEGHVLAPSV